MAKPGETGLRRIVSATRFSAQGFAHAWRHEAAFRQEVTLCALLVPAALWLGENRYERLLLIVPCLVLLIVELLNSAVEAAIDRIGHEPHALSGRAKDLGSAAVFVSLLLLAATWLIVLI